MRGLCLVCRRGVGELILDTACWAVSHTVSMDAGTSGPDGCSRTPRSAPEEGTG